ncbi:hypothetical protein DPEC_G00359420 [Dallia pectoralis]|uniref:Uncharacterized protein n=1 Tax=Dallia pectoralis TaxID=75939 RepID=A0ACC2F0L2_DALPE|nr:hypothetical protein DPEC_G00359420 [Dallia pectoralis]
MWARTGGAMRGLWWLATGRGPTIPVAGTVERAVYCCRRDGGGPGGSTTGTRRLGWMSSPFPLWNGGAGRRGRTTYPRRVREALTGLPTSTPPGVTSARAGRPDARRRRVVNGPAKSAQTAPGDASDFLRPGVQSRVRETRAYRGRSGGHGVIGILCTM